MDKINKHSHLGSYAIICYSNQIVLIEKARGPYTGMLDLPGGSIEFGESPEDAVVREVFEETGLIVTDSCLSSAVSEKYKYIQDDANYVLHHLGFLYTCKVQSFELKEGGDGLDSEGASWYEYCDLDKNILTPFAKKVVETQMLTKN